MTDVKVSQPSDLLNKFNWIEKAINIAKDCAECNASVPIYFKRKLIDDQVNRIIGIEKSFALVQPSDAYGHFCDDCKLKFKQELRLAILELESNEVVKHTLTKLVVK